MYRHSYYPNGILLNRGFGLVAKAYWISMSSPLSEQLPTHHITQAIIFGVIRDDVLFVKRYQFNISCSRTLPL